MSNHPAFWFEEVRRRVGAIADGSLVDAGVSESGIRFYKQCSQEEIGLISWDEIWMALKADLNRSRANYERLAADLKAAAESLHGPLNESAPLRILPAEEGEKA